TTYPTLAGAPANWTVEAWIYDKGNAGVQRDIIGTHSGTNAGILALSNTNTLTWIGCTTGTGTVPPNRWTHVAAAYDGANVAYYVKGVAGGPSTAANCSGWQSGWNELVIGGYGSADGNMFKGLIDEVRVYKVARNAAQIADDASLVSVHFDEASGATAFDA